MKKRTPVIGGNWKMYKDPTGTTSFFETFRPLVERSGFCEIVICPSFLDVEAAVTATRGTRIQIGAQNLYWVKEGAFTGEVSGPMIRASGCSHVIVGHSERRQYFGETNESVLKKTVAALDAGLIPIVCVGEHEKGNMEEVLTEQFRNGYRRTIGGAVRKNRNCLRTCLGESAQARPPYWMSPPMLTGSSVLRRRSVSERRRRITSASYTAAASRPTMRKVSWRSLKSTDFLWACQPRPGLLRSDRESVKLDVAFSTRTGHRASRF